MAFGMFTFPCLFYIACVYLKIAAQVHFPFLTF